MKSRKPIIPQAEFGFTSESFNLAGQSQSASADPKPKILAEMTESEREALQERSKAPEGHIFAATPIEQQARGEVILPGVSRIHLTLCGSQAGRPLCGCDKAKELEAGAKFMHAVYAPRAIFEDKRLCQECLSEWNAAEPEPATIPGLRAGSSWSVPDRAFSKAIATS